MTLRLVSLLAGAILSSAAFSSAAATAGAGFTQEHICRAAVAKVMGRTPSIIKVLKNDNGVVTTQYIRSSDNSKWTNHCHLDGNRVVWATETGPWRNRPGDEVLTYEVMNGSLEITERFSGSSSTKQSFSAKELGIKRR